MIAPVCDRCKKVMEVTDEQIEKDSVDAIVLLEGRESFVFDDLCPECMAELRKVMGRFRDNLPQEPDVRIRTTEPLDWRSMPVMRSGEVKNALLSTAKSEPAVEVVTEPVVEPESPQEVEPEPQPRVEAPQPRRGRCYEINANGEIVVNRASMDGRRSKETA